MDGIRRLSRAAGELVARPLGAIARWRGGRPMHARGAVFDAVLERHGSAPSWGVPWLDDRTTDSVVVRVSRGAGLPAPLPDLLGLAIRLPGERPVDLLLTTAGQGALTRLLPVPRREAAAGYSSIMGYRSTAGTLRLAAAGERTSDGLVFTLSAARGTGPWRPFARLTLGTRRPALDPEVRFDAVRNCPPGLAADGPMAAFRAPAYARARVASREG